MAAQEEKGRIRTELERTAMVEEIQPASVVNAPLLSEFLIEQIDERTGSRHELTTAWIVFLPFLVPRCARHRFEDPEIDSGGPQRVAIPRSPRN